MATTQEELEAQRSVTSAQVGLLVLGLVVLLALLWFFFLRGGPEEAVVVAPPVTAPTIEPTPEETDEPDRGKGPIETFEVFAPKDPFRPLISDSAGTTGSGATTSGSVAAPAGTPGTGTGTSAPSGGSDIGGGTSGGGSGGSSVGGHRVRLIDTFQAGGRARARVQVDGTVYTVDEGDRFADNFQLLSINGDCASMLFGDDQFSLCEGEEILK